MKNTTIEFNYDLGDGSAPLHLCSLDPEISSNDLSQMCSSIDGAINGLNISKLEETLKKIAVFKNIEELLIEVSDNEYEVPNPLKPYREALEETLSKKGMFNGSIMVVAGGVSLPLTTKKGGYFDFKATTPKAIPSELLPDEYPIEKTIKELLPVYNLCLDDLARYFAFAFVLLPENGEKISLVKRAKGLGISADCIAFSGGTPEFPKDHNKKDFNITDYFKNIILTEMVEEYKLNANEINIGSSYFTDDRDTIPFLSVEIITPLSLKEIAQRCYGNIDSIKEHPVIISADFNSIPRLINNFAMLPSTAYVLSQIYEHKQNK